MDKLSVRNRLAIGLATSALLMAAAAGPALAVDTVTQTITGSGLTASVADLSFVDVAYQNAAHHVTGTMVLTAADNTGSGAGWNVTIQSSAFVWSGLVPGGTDIPASAFALTSASAPVVVTGQAVSVAAATGPQVPATAPLRVSQHRPQGSPCNRRVRCRHLHPGPRRHAHDPGPEPRRHLYRHAHHHDQLGALGLDFPGHLRPRRVRAAVVGVFSLALTCVAPALALGETNPVELALLPVGQATSYFDLTMQPGETRSLEVEISNNGDREIAARTYAADVYTIVNGGFGGRLRDEPATGTTRWLDYQTDLLDLAAGERSYRSFSVTVPLDSGPGEYITSLVLENEQPFEMVGMVGADQVVRQAVGVLVTVPGERSPRLEIGQASHAVVAGRSILSVAVENSGNVRLKPLVDLTLLDSDGDEVSTASVQMDSFYAATDTFVEVPLAALLLPGEYSIEFVIEDASQGSRASGTIPLTVEAPADAPPDEGVVPGLTDVSQDADDDFPLQLVAALVAAVALGAVLTWFLIPRRRARA